MAISNYVETRTPKQVRTHAQKFQMKMARRARQSLEAGQPIQMPPGMCPVIEVPVGSKSTIVPITPEQSARLCAKSAQSGGGPIDASAIVPSLPATRTISKKRAASKGSAVTLGKDGKDKGKSKKPPSSLGDTGVAGASSIGITSGVGACANKGKARTLKDEPELESSGGESVCASDESTSTLPDACEEFIGDARKEDIEMENTFAAKLDQTLRHANASDEETKEGSELLLSDEPSKDSGSNVADDDLAELKDLEDDDLEIDPFSNPSEAWLLPDASVVP